jgi:hypothetical protein
MPSPFHIVTDGARERHELGAGAMSGWALPLPWLVVRGALISALDGLLIYGIEYLRGAAYRLHYTDRGLCTGRDSPIHSVAGLATATLRTVSAYAAHTHTAHTYVQRSPLQGFNLPSPAPLPAIASESRAHTQIRRDRRHRGGLARALATRFPLVDAAHAVLGV